MDYNAAPVYHSQIFHPDITPSVTPTTDEDFITREVQRSQLTGTNTSNFVGSEERLILSLPSAFTAITGGGETITNSGIVAGLPQTNVILDVGTGANRSMFPVGTIISDAAGTNRFRVAEHLGINLGFFRVDFVQGVMNVATVFPQGTPIFIVATVTATTVSFEIQGGDFIQGAIPAINLADTPDATTILRRVANGAIAHYTTAPLLTIDSDVHTDPTDSDRLRIILDLNRSVRPTSAAFSVSGTTAMNTFATETTDPIGSTYTFSLPMVMPTISLSITSVNETLAQFIPELIREFNDAAAADGWTMSQVPGLDNTIQITSDTAVTETGLWSVVSSHGMGAGDIEFSTFTETQNGNQPVYGFGAGVELRDGVVELDSELVGLGTELQTIVANRFFKSRGTNGLPDRVYDDSDSETFFIFGQIYDNGNVVYVIQRVNFRLEPLNPDYYRAPDINNWNTLATTAASGNFATVRGLTYGVL